MSTCRHGHIAESCFVCLATRKAARQEKRQEDQLQKLIRRATKVTR